MAGCIFDIYESAGVETTSSPLGEDLRIDSTLEVDSSETC